MRAFTISDTQNGKTLDRIIRDLYPHMPVNALYKAFRKKDIKVNGTRIKENCRVFSGDRVEIFITDHILDGVPVEGAALNRGFSVVYEDSNIIIVNKEQGIPVHPDRDQPDNTLIDLVNDYLLSTGEKTSKEDFTPALCHRLDRNTGGLVIIAKNSQSLDIMLKKIKDKEIGKYYQCLAYGKMPRPSAELKAYLVKDERKSRVFVYDNKVKDSLEIVTRYRVLSFSNQTSLLEVELVTGRTHQIRAHLAHIGHPVIGDGKYGSNTLNRSFGLKQQALWACKLEFRFTSPSGLLGYLKGKTFQVEPGFRLDKSQGSN